MRRIRKSVLDILEYLGRGAALGERPDEQKNPSWKNPSREVPPLTRQVTGPCHRSTGGKHSSSGFRILM